jgi:CheY-like chemotaxis protein
MKSQVNSAPQGSKSASQDLFRLFSLPKQASTGAAGKDRLRLMVIDDDQTFLRTIRRAGELKGCEVTWCRSIAEFNAVKNIRHDAVLMDYHLGSTNGCELTYQLEDTINDKAPVILVSNSFRAKTDAWPENIREFVHKNVGPLAIIDAVTEVKRLLTSELRIKGRSRNA